MTARRALYLASLTCALGAVPANAQAPEPPIAWIARDDLAEAAVAVADAARPVVYFNPAILRDLGPHLSSFVRAHETAHIKLQHSPTAFVRLSMADRDRAHRAAELTADCHAASRLAAGDPGAVRAAIAYFSARGSKRINSLHPTGRERAANLLKCLDESDRQWWGLGETHKAGRVGASVLPGGSTGAGGPEIRLRPDLR